MFISINFYQPHMPIKKFDYIYVSCEIKKIYMINRSIQRYLLKKKFNITYLQKIILKFLKKLEIKKICWLDSLTDYQLHCFQPETDCLIYYPNDKDNIYHQTSVKLPSLYLYYFNNIIINTHSSHLLCDFNDNIIFERVLSANIRYCNYATGFIRYHDDAHALIKYKKYKKYKKYTENIIFLGGNGVYNYYHWLIEIAPKLLFLTQQMLAKYDIKYLVIDESIKNTPSLHAILNLFLSFNNLNIKIIYENKDSIIYVKNLFYINNLNNFVFNSKEKLSSPKYSCFCPKLVNKTREVCLAELKSANIIKEFPKKIFLARKIGSIRAYNQEQILNYFEGQGFTALYIENFSFLEQVKIFNQADFIIGPSGAAWSNIIFCQPNSKALSWLPEQISGFSAFSTLAHLSKCDLRFVFTEANTADQVHSNYHVDLTKINQLYSIMKSESL